MKAYLHSMSTLPGLNPAERGGVRGRAGEDMNKLVLKIINIENPYFANPGDFKESVLEIADYSCLLEDSSNLVKRQDSSGLTLIVRGNSE